jgi:hypothetical protein
LHCSFELFNFKQFNKLSLTLKHKKMKKLYTLIALVSIAFGANAQNRGSVNPGTSHHSNASLNKHVMTQGARLNGDTLMYMPLPGYMINSTDAPTFDIVTEDIDGLTPFFSGQDMDFGLYYSTDSTMYGSNPGFWNFYHPWETPAPAGTDSAFYWQGTSYFQSPAQADNWLMFGPITIPAGGASLLWYDRFNNWRDGYNVKVSDAFSSTLTFTDFDVSSTIFTLTDDAAPSATAATDTTWQLHNVVIPAQYNGMQVAIAFNQTAFDMDVLRLDEITVIDGTLSIGINEATAVSGVKVSQNMPNPFSSKSMISYELENNAAVTLSVYDVTGKVISEQSAGTQSAGKHVIEFNAENLSAGVYYYSIKAGENTSSAVKMVVIK